MDEKSKFEALAYQRAARSIESMPEDVSIIYKIILIISYIFYIIIFLIFYTFDP